MTAEIELRTQDMTTAIRARSLSTIGITPVRDDQLETLTDLAGVVNLIQRHGALVRRVGDGPWSELAELLKAVAEKCHNQGRFDEELRLLRAAR